MRTISCNIAKSTASRSKQNGTCLSLFLRDFFQKHFVFLVNPLTRICYKLVSIWFRSSFVTFKTLKLLSKNLKSQKWVDYKYDCCLQQSGSPSCLFVIASCKVCLFVEVWRYNMLSLYAHRTLTDPSRTSRLFRKKIEKFCTTRMHAVCWNFVQNCR